MQVPEHRSDLFSVLQGYFCGALITKLHQLGILNRLSGKGTSLEGIADECGIDPQVLESLLEYLYQSCDLITKSDGHYHLAQNYQSYIHLGFHCDKFIGAYAPVIQHLEQVLDSKKIASPYQFVDTAALGRAFDSIDFHAHPMVALLQHWNVHSLLDLGCSSGLFLEELCRQDPTFLGWGIDQNAYSFERVQQRLANSSHAKRMRIHQGRVSEIEVLLSDRERQQIDCLYGSSIMNEFFGSGSQSAIDFLAYLRSLFPDRLFFIVDYYGQLLKVTQINSEKVHTLLQDLVQVLSGQGVPPVNHQEWLKIYQAAGCKVMQIYESGSTDMETFVHVIRL
jgi:hypothetical protein